MKLGVKSTLLLVKGNTNDVKEKGQKKMRFKFGNALDGASLVFSAGFSVTCSLSVFSGLSLVLFLLCCFHT